MNWSRTKLECLTSIYLWGPTPFIPTKPHWPNAYDRPFRVAGLDQIVLPYPQQTLVEEGYLYVYEDIPWLSVTSKGLDIVKNIQHISKFLEIITTLEFANALQDIERQQHYPQNKLFQIWKYWGIVEQINPFKLTPKGIETLVNSSVWELPELSTQFQKCLVKLVPAKKEWAYILSKLSPNKARFFANLVSKVYKSSYERHKTKIEAVKAFKFRSITT